jgi:hypothetical protein
VCGTNSCDGNDRLHPSSTCVAGTCRPATIIDCAPYACTVTGCKTSCAANGDCAKQNKCTLAGGTGVCGP